MAFFAERESAFGTKPKCRRAARISDGEGKADLARRRPWSHDHPTRTWAAKTPLGKGPVMYRKRLEPDLSLGTLDVAV